MPPMPTEHVWRLAARVRFCLATQRLILFFATQPGQTLRLLCYERDTQSAMPTNTRGYLPHVFGFAWLRNAYTVFCHATWPDTSFTMLRARYTIRNANEHVLRFAAFIWFYWAVQCLVCLILRATCLIASMIPLRMRHAIRNANRTRVASRRTCSFLLGFPMPCVAD